MADSGSILSRRDSMSRRQQDGNLEIKAFKASLDRVLGAENVPPEALGDLSDLLGTLRKGVRLLTDLMRSTKSFERDPAAKLLELEILVADDLRMISRDLRPNLRKMVKTAHARGTRTRQEQ